MTAYFLESSAAVKLYARETGSSRIESLFVSPLHSFWAVRITSVEVVSALGQRVRRQTLDRQVASYAVRRLRAEFDVTLNVIDVSRGLIERATDLAEHHPLRSYDAVQLAGLREARARRAGLPLPGVTFLSADVRLNAAAQAEGFTVENPNDH